MHDEVGGPLLYDRVQTHDLCHLLEDINSNPIPDITPKRSLIAQVKTLVLDYPDDTQLRSHITHAIQDALERHRPDALQHDLTRASYARLSLRAALDLEDQAGSVKSIEEGDLTPVEQKTSSRTVWDRSARGLA